MKLPLFLMIVLASPLIARAADEMLQPLKAIEELGAIAISDGSSFYRFSKDGSFSSGPIGMSGRTMTGRWTRDADGRLVVTAKLGWMNGLSKGDQYRRIIFFVSHVFKRQKPEKVGFEPRIELFNSYFFIDEMTAIAKPAEEFAK